MPNITNWLREDRAADAWKRIQEKPSSIGITRGSNTNLAAQTVRLEINNTASERAGQGGAITSVQQAIVFGVRDHATVADTNIQKGDRFDADGQKWRVISVILQTGELQAVCEMTS